MTDQTTFFNQNLWSFVDSQITKSSIRFSKFSVSNEWGPSELKLKMSVSQSKQSKNHIYLSHSDVFTMLQKIKKKVENINDIIKQINEDNKKQINVQIKIKKNIIFTFMYRIEYNGPCIRIILSDKNSDHYLDSEKVYLSIYHFLSLLKILSQFRDSYISASDNMFQSIQLDQLINSINNLNEKTSSYYSEAVQMVRGNSLLLKQQLQGSNSYHASYSPDIVSYTDKANEDDDIPMKYDNSINNVETKDDSEEVVLHDQMNDFIKEESDNVKLNIEEPKEKIEKDESGTKEKNNFTSNVLKNDILNLEMYLTNIANDELPFNKVCGLIQNKMEWDPVEHFGTKDLNSINYLISNYVKHNLKKCLEEQIDFPANIAPILFSEVELTPEYKSLMCDLTLYMIYYTQLRNVLKEKDFNPIENKDFICFLLKSICSPLAVSGINQTDKDIFINEILNRYQRYDKDGVFDKLKDKIKQKYSVDFYITKESLTQEAERIFEAVNQNYDKLTIEYSFKKFSTLGLKLDYKDFQENKFEEEQIKKIIALEFIFKLYGKILYDKISYNDFTDIPSSILEKYEVKETKYDNSNLKRFIKELTSDNLEKQKMVLDLADKINYSYRDLKNIDIDLSLVSHDILKAIFMWDISRDEKITKNYIYYRQLVQKCSLTKDMLISLLTNIQDQIDEDFFNSFITVREE